MLSCLLLQKGVKSMNVALFKYHAMKNGDTMRAVAKALHKTPTTISSYLNGKSDFSRAEIAKLRERWQLSNDDVMNIFFE